ncbi:phosphonate C-P lyase system protein PhnH [Aliagarivorans taiwanensis]|uniref:phosphonate C-P lyase system protein PhnH n=1 Tax=Aliagarivorans taiwanensis TaxID=561966 RepID=UPI0004072F18|nr:phosphonate C-P lyase system protein PhnH [Aliagarivorans taiwanensis]
MTQTCITEGMRDVVHHSQACFRQVLTALSEPGSRHTLGRHAGFGDMSAAASEVVLSLCDGNTPLWLSPRLASQAEIGANLHFHCGVNLVDETHAASFVVIGRGDHGDYVAKDFALGSEEYPDRSATVIIEVDQLDRGLSLAISGPGISGHKQICLGDLDPAWLNALREGRFPLGLDLLFVAGDQLLALPRTTVVEVLACT